MSNVYKFLVVSQAHKDQATMQDQRMLDLKDSPCQQNNCLNINKHLADLFSPLGNIQEQRFSLWHLDKFLGPAKAFIIPCLAIAVRQQEYKLHTTTFSADPPCVPFSTICCLLQPTNMFPISCLGISKDQLQVYKL